VKFYHNGKENAGDFVEKMKLYGILPHNTRGYIYKTGDDSLNIKLKQYRLSV
jgi:hypothetical protein